MPRSIDKISLISILLLAHLLGNDFLSKSQNKITFLDVGQGDSILIRSGKDNMLIIDGGTVYSDSLTHQYMPCCDCISNVSLLLTHPHSDHLIGLDRTLSRCKNAILYFNDIYYDSKAFTRFKNRSKGLVRSDLTRGERFEVGDFDIYVLWPTKSLLEERGTKDINNTSIVLLVDYQNFEALLTGDIDKNIQKKLNLEEYKHIIDNKIDVYKVPHHGSSDSFDPDFLAYLKPKLAVVSVGKNMYGHPNKKFIEYFARRQVPILRTDIHGTIGIKVLTNTVTM